MWPFKHHHEEHAFTDREISRLRVKVGMLESSVANRDEYISYIKSRILGIQHHGKSNGNGETVYTIQQPNGKFGKFYLPTVNCEVKK